MNPVLTFKKFMILQPQRCLDRALCEDDAAFGAVAELDALAFAREEHLVIAGRRAAAQAREADMSGGARSGETPSASRSR